MDQGPTIAENTSEQMNARVLYERGVDYFESGDFVAAA